MFNFIYSLKKENTHNYLLLALAFFITISVYITDLIVIALIIAWIIGGDYKNKLKIIFSSPLLVASIYFLIYFFASYLWSDSSIWNIISQKQVLILLLPILYTLNFDEAYINKAKSIFILGLILNILLSIITIYLPSNPFFKTGHYDSSLFLHGFLDHFDYSIFLCFGVFMVLSSLSGPKFWRNCFLIVLFLIALFNSYGRIGIVSFFIFFPIIIRIYHPQKLYYYILIFVLSFGLISYYLFPPLHNRVNQTVQSIKLLSSEVSLIKKIENDAMYLSSKNDTLSKNYFITEIMNNKEWINSIKEKQPQYETSIGKRYLYAKNSLDLIKEKPLFGFGSNQFKEVYTNRFRGLNMVNHPHNNFLFILVELGLVGLILLLNIFYCQLKLFFINIDKNILGLVFPLYFLWIMLFDNYFLNHNTLVFFCLFSLLIYYKKI